jgi:hypothetical protein
MENCPGGHFGEYPWRITRRTFLEDNHRNSLEPKEPLSLEDTLETTRRMMPPWRTQSEGHFPEAVVSVVQQQLPS